MNNFNIVPVNRKTVPAIIVMGLVILLAGYMRFTTVTHTAVIYPYRADAAKYYNYAYNLRNFSVYSNSPDAIFGKRSNLSPDAQVTPGYPLFLSLFAVTHPNFRTFLSIELWQAFLSTVTVLLIFLIFREILPLWVAILVALLAAISPQLINTCVYILSETLFTFLLALSLLLLLLHRKRENARMLLLLIAGIVFGLAALTRPILQYFLPLVILLLLITYKRRLAIKMSTLIFLGFILLWTPWIVRNFITLGKPGNSALMINTIQFGSYPYFMYNNDPRTLGFPYRFDPQAEEAQQSMRSVLNAVEQKFKARPVEETTWYLFGKPTTLWSWGEIAGAGDIFIYPVASTPYANSVLFSVTHSTMRMLHRFIIIAAFIGCILIWLSLVKKHFSENQIFALRSLSLLLLYFTALLMIGAPLPRYAIPFLPIAYGMGIAVIYFVLSHAFGNRMGSINHEGRHDNAL